MRERSETTLTSSHLHTYKRATKTRKTGWLILAIASISNPQWKRAREMVADIGHRYISEGAKGSALEHKKIASPYSKRQPPLRFYHLHPLKPSPLLRYWRSQPPSDLWSILYIRYFLLSIAPICLIYVSFRDHPRLTLRCFSFGLAGVYSPPPTLGQVPRPLSCEIHPLRIRTVDRPLDISKDLLAMQTRRYIKTIYFRRGIGN